MCDTCATCGAVDDGDDVIVTKCYGCDAPVCDECVIGAPDPCDEFIYAGWCPDCIKKIDAYNDEDEDDD
jgi:hypothetical protein